MSTTAKSVTGLFDSPLARGLSTVSMVVEAAVAAARGERGLAAALLGAAAVAYRWSALGLAVEIGIRAYRRLR